MPLFMVYAMEERRDSRQESDSMLERVLLDLDKLFHRYHERLLFSALTMARSCIWLRTVCIFSPLQISPGMSLLLTGVCHPLERVNNS